MSPKQRVKFEKLSLLLALVLALTPLGLLPKNALSFENRTTELSLNPTAKTLGKGGYSSSIGFFEFSKLEPSRPEIFPRFEDVDIGFFNEKHSVYYDADASLLPIKISYGVSESLDLTFGSTYSTGISRKVIADYYQIGDQKIQRSYPQSLFDGFIGVKYAVKPGSEDSGPMVSIGGDIQLGYTADDLSPVFDDPTPLDSYPFLGLGAFIVGTQDFPLVVVNGGLLVYGSTKPKSFRLGYYIGGEFPLTEKFSFMIDLASLKAISGVTFKHTLSPGIRYNFTQRAAVNLGFNTSTGFQFGLFVVSGEMPSVAPKAKDDLLF